MTEQTYKQRVNRLRGVDFSRCEAEQTADVEFGQIDKRTVFATVTWTGEDIWQAIWDFGEGLSPEAKRRVYQKTMSGPDGENVAGESRWAGDNLLTSVLGNALEDALMAQKASEGLPND